MVLKYAATSGTLMRSEYGLFVVPDTVETPAGRAVLIFFVGLFSIVQNLEKWLYTRGERSLYLETQTATEGENAPNGLAILC